MTEQETIEELKSYRACGGTCYPTEIEVAISALEEIQQYRELGTVEELREAREKQMPKKPIFHIAEYKCPKCGEMNLEELNEYGNTVRYYKYCPDCGQAIDWSE